MTQTFNEKMKELLKKEAAYVRAEEKAKVKLAEAQEKLDEAMGNLGSVRQEIARIAQSVVSSETESDIADF